MFRNLQIEWMKIKNYRVFQVFSVLYLIGIIVIIYIFYKWYMALTGKLTGNDAADIFKLFSSDAIWTTVCFFTSFLLYLPGMVLINLFINEVNFKTHRQNIIDGWKRETFIYTKIGLILCICLVVTIMNMLATWMMCSIINVDFSITSGIKILGLCFLQTFIYLMFALLLAILFRRSGVAIIVFFVYGLILEFLFMWLFYKILPGAQYFLPLQAADSLISFRPMNQGLYGEYPGLTAILIGALAYGAFYVFFAVRKYKHDDL
jgi:ABC-2 type transport system permease protein